jgi:uncharacterized membrane protein YfcA
MMGGAVAGLVGDVAGAFDFSVVDVAIIAVLSLLICVLATSLAVGSAAIFLPAFMVGFPFLVPAFPTVTTNEAIGLTLIVMFFGQTSTLTGYIYRRQVRFDVASTILVLTLPLAALGRILSYYVPDRVLLSVFVALVFVLAVVLYRSHAAPDEQADGGCDTELLSPPDLLRFDSIDRVAFGSGGFVAGLVGFGIGEVINTCLYTKKDLGIRMSTGTSTFILFFTLLVANVVNLALLRTGAFGADGTVKVPLMVAVIIAPAVLVGGQVGAYLNSRLPEHLLVRLLLAVYLFVGLIALGRVVVGV